MASTASPYGLRPVRKIGGEPWVSSFTQWKIASDYGTNIFQGDLVKLMSTGYIEKATNTSDAPTNGFLGVFWGAQYIDPDMGFVTKNWYDHASIAVVADALVISDPDVIFQIQASGSLDIAAIGARAHLVQTAGSTVTGRSAVALDSANVNTTATFPLAIVGAPEIQGFSALGDAFTDLYVRINIHTHRTATGI